MTFKTLVNNFIYLLRYAVYILMGMALVVFLWGLVNYISQSGDAGKRSESRQYIIYGIIGLFVMTAVWGLLLLLTGTFLGIRPGIPQITL